MTSLLCYIFDRLQQIPDMIWNGTCLDTIRRTRIKKRIVHTASEKLYIPLENIRLTHQVNFRTAVEKLNKRVKQMKTYFQKYSHLNQLFLSETTIHQQMPSRDAIDVVQDPSNKSIFYCLNGHGRITALRNSNPNLLLSVEVSVFGKHSVMFSKDVLELKKMFEINETKMKNKT